MTRGDQAASKTATIREMTQSKILEVAKFEGSKPRKLRMESEIGSHSARSRLTEIKDRPQGTCRTRSVSPTPFKQPLPFELPLKKFNNIYSKVVTQLETVNNLSEKKSNEADNIFDLRRQLQRADEFAIRFSRNNLYETKRILNDIKKIMTPFSFENLSTNEGKTLGNKIMLGYQAASQSLQIYINYIKNPANIEVPEKICELVVLVTDLFLCCEQFCPSSNETNLGNHAIKICNQLVTMLKSKLPAGEYVDTKQENASKKKFKKFGRVEDLNKIKNFSMYETRPIGRTKLDCIPKKKFGVPYLFGNKQKKMKKKDERKARITHEIYTQKMSSRRRRSLGTKIVKFESFEGKDCERSESAAEKKLGLKKSKFFTPREVKSQDDDVETMVQTIDDEELPTFRINLSPQESEGESVASSFNKMCFRELLLEAIRDLQNSDKKEQKATLKKLLTSIQNCSKSKNNSPRAPAVKVYHFKHNDSEDEKKEESLEENKTEEIREKVEIEAKNSPPTVDSNALSALEGSKTKDGIKCRERRLNVIFTPIKQRVSHENQTEDVPKGKIRLNITEAGLNSIKKDKKSFDEFRKNNIMYRKAQAVRPWELVEKVSDLIILDIIKEIAGDFQSDSILNRLYFNELLEVVN